MWQCHKCSKPVYFAERKQSLGYDWHPECLRCEECGKRLNVGQHEEHKGVPYCHVPCYGALFGPQLFGHGSRVESHKSFGAKGTTAQRAASQNQMPFSRDYIDLKIKQYNDCFDNKSNKIRGREVNGRMILEGALRVYWGVQSMIHLKEDDDQRTVITVRKRNSCRYSNATDYSSEKSLLNSHSESLKENYDTNETSLDINTSSAVDGGDTTDISMTESISFDTCSVQSLNSASSSKNVSPDHKALTMPIKLNDKQLERDELDELLQVERAADINTKLYQTLPSPSSSTDLSFASNAACGTTSHQHDLSKSDSSEPISNETDFKSAENTLSSSDERTLTNKSTTDDEYLTPNNTLRAMDFDDFGQQMRKEFLENSNLLQSSMDDSLKYKQPIDPSRINDSLRIYGESMMSKSFSGEAAFREVPATVYPYHTLKEHRSDISSNSSNCTRKKSEPSPVTSSADSSVSTENGINRSKSGPNWYRNHSYLDDNDSDESSATLKPTTIKRHTINIKMDCYDELGSNGVESNTSSTATSTIVPTTTTYNDDDDDNDDIDANESVVVLRKPKTGSTAIKRRSGNRRTRTKLKRRCSINGHFYNRETSFFTPPHGSQMSVWASSLVSTEDVVNLLLEKYKVDSQPEHFALFVIRDNGEQRRLRDDEYPLVVRIMLGPHEDVARIFLMDANNTSEISCEVAQFINLSIQECRAILDRYDEEQNREVEKIKDKYADFRQKLVQRMESLKVRL